MTDNAYRKAEMIAAIFEIAVMTFIAVCIVVFAGWVSIGG